MATIILKPSEISDASVTAFRAKLGIVDFRIVSGGQVTVTGNTVTVSELTFTANDQTFTVPASNFTIQETPESGGRFDVLYLQRGALNSIKLHTGTASERPLKWNVNPLTEIELVTLFISETKHARAHQIDSIDDHPPVAIGKRGKLVATNPISGAIELIDIPEGGGGDYILPVATSSTLGGVKIGSGVSVSVDGTISVSTNYEPLITASTSAYYLNGLKEWTLFPTTLTLSALSANIPLRYNNTTGVFTIDQANTSTHGYLSSTDWNLFNNKVSFPGFGTTHYTAAYGDHTHSQYITGNYVTSFNTRSGVVALTKLDVEQVLTGVISTHSHAGSSGTVTSVQLSAPAGFTVSSLPITTAGTIILSYASGYSLPTIADQSNWNTAYNWGNHAGLYDKFEYFTFGLGTSISNIYGKNATIGQYKGIGLIAGNNITIDGTSLDGLNILTINAANSVSSVGLSLPSIFNVTNSPVTGSGTLTAILVSQTAGRVFAAPSTSNGVPSFQSLTINHLPTGTTSTTVALGNHNHTIASLSDTSISSISSNEILKWNGSSWINNTLAEAGISAVGHTHNYDNYVAWQFQNGSDSFDVTASNWLKIDTVIDSGITLNWSSVYHRLDIINNAKFPGFGVTSAVAAYGNHTHNNYVPFAGGTMTGALVAAANSSGTVTQVANVRYGTSATPPTGTPNGTIYLRYI